MKKVKHINQIKDQRIHIAHIFLNGGFDMPKKNKYRIIEKFPNNTTGILGVLSWRNIVIQTWCDCGNLDR